MPNNNIVSVRINGDERILFGKGIGSGKRFWDKIENGDELEKVFVI